MQAPPLPATSPGRHAHVLAVQYCVSVQLVVHPPQASTFAVVSTHVPPQLIWLAAHAHRPFWQTPDAQVLLHPPQFAGSFATSRHCVPHATCPDGHVAVQPPAAQNLELGGHALPQLPQLAGSVELSTHRLPQVSPRQVPGTQPPAEHASLIAHAWPQVPQLLGSAAASTHPPPHARKPPLQVATQAAASQNGFVAVQVMPQPPQFTGSDTVSRHTLLHNV